MRFELRGKEQVMQRNAAPNWMASLKCIPSVCPGAFLGIVEVCKIMNAISGGAATFRQGTGNGWAQEQEWHHEQAQLLRHSYSDSIVPTTYLGPSYSDSLYAGSWERALTARGQQVSDASNRNNVGGWAAGLALSVVGSHCRNHFVGIMQSE